MARNSRTSDEALVIYASAQEALAHFKSLFHMTEIGRYGDNELTTQDKRELLAYTQAAAAVMQVLSPVSTKPITQLLDLLRAPGEGPLVTFERWDFLEVNPAPVKFNQVHVVAYSIPEKLQLALRIYRQRYRLDARTPGRSTVTARVLKDPDVEATDVLGADPPTDG